MPSHRSPWIRLVLLLMITVVAASCTRRINEDDVHGDPEGRDCIPIQRALEIPPRYCPLQKFVPNTQFCNANPTDPKCDTSAGPTYNEGGLTIPVGETVVSATEWTNCLYANPEGGENIKIAIYAGQRCPASTQTSGGATGPALNAGNPDVEQEGIVPCQPSPYPVPVLNEAYPTRGPVSWLYSEIVTIMLPASQQMYNAIAGTEEFKTIMLAMLTLLIAFYAISVTLQIRPPSIYDFMIFILKIAFIFTFALNWEVFRDIVIYSLDGANGDGAIDALMQAAVNAGTSASTGGGGTSTFVASDDIYDTMDNILAGFFSWNFQKFMLALLMAGWTGKLYFILLIIMILSFMFAAFSVMQVILIALLGRMFLYALAPLFIACALLDATKQIFRNWLELLLSFSLQPILLGAFLGMFLSLILMLVTSVVSGSGLIYYICYRPWQWVKNWVDFIFWWQFTDAQGDPRGGETINIYAILTVIILSDLMRGMSQWLVRLATIMTSGFVAASGTFIAGAQTAAEYAKVVPASAIGGLRGAVWGNRAGGGSADAVWKGGMFRGGAGGAASGMFKGAARAGGAQAEQAKKTMAKEFGGFGRNT